MRKKYSKRISKKKFKEHMVDCLSIGPFSKKSFSKLKYSRLLKHYEILKYLEGLDDFL